MDISLRAHKSIYLAQRATDDGPGILLYRFAELKELVPATPFLAFFFSADILCLE
ncbi:hypothetical protein LCGC14_0647520 [marine sediment metagenome]|uniref:Uncharacterized protein n=1 Tax=marine sediment metagenome TaxID=412755 RepID=A0A0F9QXB4_9ZZZZ